MQKKIILSGIPARQALAEGAKKVADAVSKTLGPFGLNFFLEKKQRPTNDGVTVAREIQLDDEIENLGAGALREAAIKTNEEAGDGTTTAIILAWAIYDAASRLLASEGIVIGKKTPSEVIRQIETERKEVTEKLIAMATPIETKEQLIDSARVAVENEELGTLIGEAQWDVGKDGYLIAEETADRTSSSERISGIRIDNGVGTTNVFNNAEKQTLEIEKMPIILTSETMRDLKPVVEILEQLAKQGQKDIVILARAWTEEAIKLCQLNFEKGLHLYPLNAPYVDMKEVMRDISAITGATFYDSESTKLEDIQMSDIGYIEKIKAGRYDAIITGSDNEKTLERVTARVKELEDKLKGSPSDFEKKLLSQRIAQLQNGFGLIKIGSPSDMERKRLFDKAEDAVNAVRAAYQEGTVQGAGLAFKEIAESLPDSYLLKRPLLAPYQQIMSSSPSDFVIEEWVRDPVKVLRIALEKACVAASSFATAGGAIVSKTPDDLTTILTRSTQDGNRQS